MASGNDAAYALARVGGGAGGVPQSLAAMNARAAQLGAFDTVARDPAGLDRPGQTSSAYDLALIGRAALQLPDLPPLRHDQAASFPGGTGPGRQGAAGVPHQQPQPAALQLPRHDRRQERLHRRREADLHRRRLPRRPHLPRHRDGRHQRQLAPHGCAAGLGLRPRRPSSHRWAGWSQPGSVHPSDAGGAPAAGPRSPPWTARAPDPAAGGDGRGPGAGCSRARRGVRPAAAQPLGRRRRARRRGAAGRLLVVRRATAAPAAAAPPQISSFCLICPLSRPNRLVDTRRTTDARPHSPLVRHHAAPVTRPDRAPGSPRHVDGTPGRRPGSPDGGGPVRPPALRAVAPGTASVLASQQTPEATHQRAHRHRAGDAQHRSGGQRGAVGGPGPERRAATRVARDRDALVSTDPPARPRPRGPRRDVVGRPGRRRAA